MELRPTQPPRSDLGESVCSDLEYLARNWVRSLDEATVRRDSTVLRRLLLDKGGTLRRYRKEMGAGGEPRVRAIDLRAAVPGDWASVILAAAGGATVGVITIALIEMRSTPMPDPPAVTFPTRDYKLAEFLDHPCLIIAGQAISRREIINYVANKLGGVHFDPRRAASDRAFMLLDKHRRELYVQDVDMLHYELLAIGQHLLRSAAIAPLISPELRLDPAMPGIDGVMSWELLETIDGP